MMTNSIQSRKVTFLLMGGLVALAALLLLISPEEQELGAGIRFVYVHVAFIWTGMLGLSLLSLPGLLILLNRYPSIQSFAQTLGWVSLIAFVIGIILSMAAAGVNWGAVFWAEPRYRVNWNIVAVTVIILIVINHWLSAYRLRGLLYFIPAILLLGQTLFTPLVLHPRSPVVSTSPTSMQLTFIGFFALCALASGWIIFHLEMRKRKLGE